jgi:hypothetical protein
VEEEEWLESVVEWCCKRKREKEVEKWKRTKGKIRMSKIRQTRHD